MYLKSVLLSLYKDVERFFTGLFLLNFGAVGTKHTCKEVKIAFAIFAYSSTKYKFNITPPQTSSAFPGSVER